MSHFLPHLTRAASCLAALAAATIVATTPAQAQTQTAGTTAPVVAIANLGPHPALARTIDGFKTEMAHEGFVEGKSIKYVYSDANFTQALMPQMFQKLMTDNPALFLTVTTSVSQVARSAVNNPKIPLVFAEVTDPVAAGLVPSWDHGDARMNGSSDLQNFDAVMTFAKKLFPNAKSFGTLYNPGEVNDTVTTKALQAAATRAGLAFRPVSVDSVNDIVQRAQMLQGVDFVYITGSNLVQSAIPAVAASMGRLRIPIISSETEAIKHGEATASYAVSFESVGANAAKLAAKILRGAAPASLPVALPTDADYVTSISKTQMQKLGLPVPSSFENCQCFIN